MYPRSTESDVLPLLPMQARSLANSAKAADTRFFSWAAISDPQVEPERLKHCLDLVVHQTESLRAALSCDQGQWVQRIVPQKQSRDYVPLIRHQIAADTESAGEIVARHAPVIDNTTGTNVALIALVDGAVVHDILLLANHFFLDFYSASWLTAEAFRHYRGEKARVLPPASFGDLCHWMDARARDPQILGEVLAAIRPNKRSLNMPSFIAKALRPAEEACAQTEITFPLGPNAVRQFRGLVKNLRTNDYWLGLALLGYVEGSGTDTPATLHVSIKESGRGILPLNTLGLPSFLAATSEISMPTAPGVPLEAYFAQLSPIFARSNRLGVSVSNFALPDLPDDLVAAASRRVHPALLYNSVNINAFSAKPQPEGSFGIYRDGSYTKREDLEVRFIHARDAIQISVSTTKPIDISKAASAIGAGVERALSICTAVAA